MHRPPSASRRRAATVPSLFLASLAACARTPMGGADSVGGDPAAHDADDSGGPGSEDTGEVVDADGDGVPAGEDCDDDNAAVHDGADEQCDGVDNDCDGAIDEDATDATSWYADEDGDGYGSGAAVTGCEPPAGRVDNGDDCNDGNGEVHPSADGLSCGDCDGSRWVAELDGAFYTDLQRAISDADEGQTVHVCPGVHPAPRNLGTAARTTLTLASWSGAAADTVLSGGSERQHLHVGTDSHITLRGLTFADFGAQALNVTWSDLTIEGCIFRSNSNESGGAIGYVMNPSRMDWKEATIAIRSSTFSGNHAAERGGAIYIEGLEYTLLHLVIEDSTFTNNTAGEAGGVLAYELTNDHIAAIGLTRSTLDGNSSGGVGGAIAITGSTGLEVGLDLDRAVLDGNTAAGAGGAIHLDRSLGSDMTGSVRLVDSAITANTSTGDGPGGVLIAEGWSLESVATDWGAGESDNVPGDVDTCTPDTAPYDDLGTSESFSCEGGTGCWR